MTAPKFDDATARQVLAADPGNSTWVSANAGSGKTRVLTDRVARLLLNGVPPERILCLTYTKAAAAEMQNRLFRRLGEWAMLPDAALRAALAQLGEVPPDGVEGLAAARRLFARAIEAPGGLKIQTIHAFCASLLRRFPLEAGVSPQFQEMDDRAGALLRDEIVEAMADGSDRAVVEGLVRVWSGDDFGSVTAEIAGNRVRFDRDRTVADWRADLGVPAGLDEDALLSRVFLGSERPMIAAVLASLDPEAKLEKKPHRLLSSLGPDWTLSDLIALEEVCLTGSGAKEPFTAKVGGACFPKKATRAALGDTLRGWDDFLRRIESARPQRLALSAAEKCHALHAFARPFLQAYAARKQALGLLDFDDLILLARDLLRRPGVAEWVLFRLDGGIDHILVDEAQDTSPDQWEVIRLIAEEFSAGASARSDVLRTIFVVGDLKQSIYSFQGADPANFDRMAGHFEGRLTETGSNLARTDLLHSFRSAPAILRAVDEVFADEALHRGLGGPPQHVAFHGDRPGRVDLWPAVPKDEAEEEADWTDPVDRVQPANPDVVLARAVASEIRRLCSSETLPLGGGNKRPLTPGDFLILVQRRSTLFGEVIRACKREGLPIAGADRLRLGAELAVRDLAALLQFLALPEDDLSLAAALRSPLFGWSEDDLFRAAHGRPRYLWNTVYDRGGPTVEMLRDLREQADFLRPYELLERVLTRHGGRQRLIARLGPEAEDGIDALLGQAMGYERMEVPSLTGFLTYLETEEVEVKRQLSSGGGVVRVMTVHGAKGLEAPVVILPDTRAAAGQDRGQILADGDMAWWKMAKDDAPEAIRQALEARAERMRQERMRLLYVAMTRAESWLIVAGAGDTERGEQGWHDCVRAAMGRLGARALDTPVGEGLRFDLGTGWDEGALVVPDPVARVVAEVPDWARVPPEPAAPDHAPRAPTSLGGDKVILATGTGRDPVTEEAAMLRGTRLHLLFEHLPGVAPDARPALARLLLCQGEEPATGAEADALMAEAARVLDDPILRGLFALPALTEVEVSADLPRHGPIMGLIDRLIVTESHIRAIDYKTNATVPARPEDVPEGILRQMGAYAACLERVYPGRIVDTAILWTAVPSLMVLPDAVVRAALARA
jgi:ATP-dependent helicase/nuclease subunit A